MKVPWNKIRAITGFIDAFTETIGKAISSLNLLLVLIVCLVVVLRYLLNLGSIAMQESAIYLHAIIFLGASGYTLKRDEHVRVDVFYRRMNPRPESSWLTVLEHFVSPDSGLSFYWLNELEIHRQFMGGFRNF